ncbi:hypothetical protein IWZ03DRAFT_196742 [Phyllosticta citriasiana]|uniref:RING-type domain-containing protein n=2 Tax=Phyllosticta citriasiana TaxID=595635 RepID=A0ABR1KL00_9PEZI
MCTKTKTSVLSSIGPSISFPNQVWSLSPRFRNVRISLCCSLVHNLLNQASSLDCALSSLSPTHSLWTATRLQVTTAIPFRSFTMAQQRLPLFLPPGYVQGADVDDDILLEIQLKFIEDLPEAVEADTNGVTVCPCGDDYVFRPGPRLRKRGTWPAKLPCGHILCDTCINKWLTVENNCPYCRCPFFLKPRWSIYARAGIREYYDRYWETHRWEMRPILEQDPLAEHNVNFKNTAYQYELVVLAQVFLNELIHSLPGARMGLTHQENIDYTDRVQDRLEHWMNENKWQIRLRDNAWRPDDVFDHVARDPQTAAFVRRIGNLTAEFLNRALSVEFMFPVNNANLFNSLVLWLYEMERIDPEAHDDWKNQAILCMVHCLSHVAQDEDVMLAWEQANRDYEEFSDLNGGPYPASLRKSIRRQAGMAAIADENTTYINEGYTPRFRVG